MSLSAIQQLVAALVRDADQVLSPVDRDNAIATAVTRVGEDRPRIVVVDVTGNGTHRIAPPTGWVVEFSAVRSAEYPVGNVPTTMLDTPKVYTTPTGELIELPVSVPSGQTIRLHITLPHTVTASTNTVPARDRHALATWAAHLLCDQLANHYATSVSPVIAADAVNHGSKSSTFRQRSNDYRAQYLKHMGLDERRAAPASVTVDIDQNTSLGTGRIWRRKGYR